MTTDHSRQVIRVDNHVEGHAATPCTLRHVHVIRVADDRADQELHGVVNHGLLLLVEDALDLVIAVAGVTLGDLDLDLGALVGGNLVGLVGDGLVGNGLVGNDIGFDNYCGGSGSGVGGSGVGGGLGCF